MSKKMTIVGVSTHFGQDKCGVDMGPDAIRYASLIEELQLLGHQVLDVGNISVTKKKTVISNLKLNNLEEVKEVCAVLAGSVSRIIEDKRFPIVLGGDHSIAIGTVAGVMKHYNNLGIIWFDAHGDVNTPETTPSGNIHGMSLAVLLGYGDESLRQIGETIRPENVVVIGARSLDEGEKVFMREKGIKVYTMHEIDKRGMHQVMSEALNYVSHCDGIHVSLDLDGLDPLYAPGVGTRVVGGITYREGHLAMEMMAESGKIVSLELVEVNPILDEYNKTAVAAVGLTTSLLGKRITKE